MKTLLRISGLGAAAALVAGLGSVGSLGCSRDDPNKLGGSGQPAGPAPVCADDTTTAGPGGSTGGTTTSTGTGQPPPPVHTVLDDRIEDYAEALRTASFKLVGNAPTLAQIEEMRAAANPKAAYETMVDQMMAQPAFYRRMIEFWKTTMRMGGPAVGGKPSRDTAPTFAARITVLGTQPYTDLFTATENTCPTFDGTSFADGSCVQPNIPTTGILTDPGVQMQYYGNLAFRRVRFFQEAFACHKMPAELSEKPVPVGPQMSSYTGPWPFNSIATNENGGLGRIDFQDTSGAICANCHVTSNHRAPLFANFDANGVYQNEISVLIPVTGSPVAVRTDWLPDSETTAFRFNVPAPTLVEYGAAMAKDEEIIACPVARMWNYAMSKGDIVIDASAVPSEVIAPLLDEFKGNGYNLQKIVRAIFVHDDFVRF